MTSTTSTTSTPSAGSPALSDILDAAAVARLLDSYLIGLDTGELDDDWARGLFTDDAAVVFPMSRHDGIAGLAAWHRESLAAFAATQHLHSPAVTDVRGSVATLRANLVSTHVHHPGGDRPPLFVTGTGVTGEARRSDGGHWRLSRLEFTVIWMEGTPPGAGADRRAGAGG